MYFQTTLKNKPSGFIRFNRHKILNSEDRLLVLALSGTEDEELNNKLRSLFDGLFYKDIIKLGRLYLNSKELAELITLIDKIKKHL